MMKRRNVLVGLGLVLFLALVPLVSVQARSNELLYLDWHKVVPSGSGDPNMLGEATVDVNPGQASVCYWMRVFIYPYFDWPPTGATINHALAGENGPAVVNLNPTFGPLGDATVSGCVHIGKSLAHDLQKNPADYYLLVTDSTHPAGAARVQLAR